MIMSACAELRSKWVNESYEIFTAWFNGELVCVSIFCLPGSQWCFGGVGQGRGVGWGSLKVALVSVINAF